MIYPTLFIGLGTQGLKILEELQKLVVEEYNGKLPIFEYIYFETDENTKPEIQTWAENEIRMPQPFPVIQKLKELRDEFNAGKKGYLSLWLNGSLLRFPKGAFIAGAGHIRMAGRLCLWENWTACAAVVESAKNTITGAQNIAQTINFLRDFYDKVGKRITPGEQLISPQPNVYIFGTLCGGTCGGMFIDVAYLIRHMFGLRGGGRTAKLKGIFTIHDYSKLIQPKDDLDKKRSANCWASLIELDYYSHKDTDYSITWPDGERVEISDPPFDYVYLLSCSGDKTNLRLPDGGPDIKALNHMAAMILFSETVSDLLSKKEAITINFIGHPKFNTPYCETDGGKKEHSMSEDMPMFATCGLSAVWYPKYRIAEASACYVAIEICNDWLGKVDSDAKQRIEREAKNKWEDILRNSLPSLTHKPGGSIEDEIRKWFESERKRLLDIPIQEMIKVLRNELEKFGEEGEHDREISRPERLTEFENKIKESLKNTIIEAVNNTSNLTYAEYPIERLDIAVEETLQGLLTKYPRPELSKIRSTIKVDRWARFVLMEKLVEQQKKEDFLNDCLDYFLECLILIRGFRTKPILERIRRYLGVKIQPSADEPKRLHILKQEVIGMKTLLEDCIKELDEKGKELSQEVVVHQNMQLIYESDQNTMEEDIRQLKARLYNLYEDEREVLLRTMMTVGEGAQQRVMALYEFIKTGKDKVIEAMITVLRLKALDIIGRFNIAQKLLEREDPEVLRHFARRAEPYLELAGQLVEVPDPHFMMGNDAPGAPNLTRLCNDVLNNPAAQNRIDFSLPTESSLIDHLLIFYKEKGLLYKGENFATVEYFKSRYEEISKDDPYGLFTHKNGEFEFDPRRKKREKEVCELMEIVTNLFFYRDDYGKWQKSKGLIDAEDTKKLELKVFKIERNELILGFKAKDGSDVTLLTDESEKFRLSRDAYSFDLFRHEIDNIMENIGDKGYINQLNDYLMRLDELLTRQGVSFKEIVERKEAQRKQFIERKDKYLVKKPVLGGIYGKNGENICY